MQGRTVWFVGKLQCTHANSMNVCTCIRCIWMYPGNADESEKDTLGARCDVVWSVIIHTSFMHYYFLQQGMMQDAGRVPGRNLVSGW